MGQFQMDWDEAARRNGKPVGLKNVGNNCYMNSVLQCLTYTPPLANYCVGKRHSSHCTSGNPMCLLEKRIARSLSNSCPSVDTPLDILESLNLFADYFTRGEQEDANEFFLRAIDSRINSCCENDNFLRNTFKGIIRNQIKCTSCGLEAGSEAEFVALPIHVKEKRSCSLEECLKSEFESQEILQGDNMYMCNMSCNTRTVATCKVSISRPPNVLALHFVRFGVSRSRNGTINTHIAFQEHLHGLGHYIVPTPTSSTTTTPLEYELYAVIVHRGHTIHFGHFYAFVKDANGAWFKCDDASVTSVTATDVLKENAYMLFFIRRSGNIPNPHDTANANYSESAPQVAHDDDDDEELLSRKLPLIISDKQADEGLNSSPIRPEKPSSCSAAPTVTDSPHSKIDSHSDSSNVTHPTEIDNIPLLSKCDEPIHEGKAFGAIVTVDATKNSDTQMNSPQSNLGFNLTCVSKSSPQSNLGFKRVREEYKIKLKPKKKRE